MRMKRISVTLFIWIVFITQTYSQQYNFTNYSINEGLSQSVVNCVFQDSRAYIWIGTQNGLNRFNGESFDVYNYSPVDSNSISNNWIYSIAEDKEGNLWLGTKNGINKYIFNENRFEQVNYLTEFVYDVTRYPYDLICLSNGNILINTPPIVSIFNISDNSFKHFRSRFGYDGSVKDVKIPVLEDSKGKVWIGTTLGLTAINTESGKFSDYRFYNKKNDLIEYVDITSLFKDKHGTIWVGTSIGLFKYNESLKNFKEARFITGDNKVFSFENICIRSVLEDKNGNLLVGTEGNGLFVFDYSQNSAIIQNYTSENSLLGHNIIQSLLIDKSENLWIGTLNGISKTDLKKSKFNLYRNSNSPKSIDLLGNVIASLYKNDDGILWVGNWGQGLNLVNRTTGEVEHFSSQHSGNHKISNDFVHVIFKDNNQNIWLGTRDGILVYNKSENRFIPLSEFFNNQILPSFNNTRIYMIIRDKYSNYWIGTQNGLYKINIENSSVEVFQNELEPDHRLSANLVYCLLEDSEGLIWIATVNGLDLYNPETGKIKHFRKDENELSDDLVISLCEDSEGKIWIGTGTYINIYNKQDSSFTWYGKEQGLPNNHIYEIVKDKSNNIWIATGKGLCKFDEKQNTFQTYLSEGGLQGLEFNLNAAYVCNDGELLIGGMNGFNSFYPDSISRNPFVPNLVFTSFYTAKGSKTEYGNIEDSEKIVLKYNISSFTVEFAALEFTNPNRNSYQYQMEGISNEWVDVGNRRFNPFSGLPPGEYVFKVKGSNNDGVWNDNAIVLNIVILPPWWRSIYAYLAYLVLIIVAIVVFIKQRERKLIRDKKNLEQKVLERTLQIEKQNQLIVSKNQELEELNHTKDKLFSIIGHDLGNQFNIILGFLDVLVSDFKRLNQEKVEVHLNNINNSSKQAYNLLENLLTWARMQTNLIQYLPKDFDVLSKIQDSIVFFEGACAKKNITIGVAESEGIIVSADLNMFSTVFRNLVSNAIKFTNENGTISISLEKLKDFCKIVIEDDGIGISKEEMARIFKIGSKHKTLGTQGEKGTGLGLVLCKEFVEKQGGTLNVESQPGKGSKFSFTLPLKKN